MENQETSQAQAKAWYDDLFGMVPGFLKQFVEILVRLINQRIDSKFSTAKEEIERLKNESTKQVAIAKEELHKQTSLAKDEIVKAREDLNKYVESQLAQVRNEMMTLKKSQADAAQAIEAKINQKTAAISRVIEVLGQTGASLQQIK